MVERKATCVCGQLAVSVEGDPYVVNMCHCKDCQKRSGSAFQIGAFFDDSQLISIQGKSKQYERSGSSGGTVNLHFCPNCGVSVFFRATLRPGALGIHGGCFADPEFPAPNRALWTSNKYHWVTVPEVESSYKGNGQISGT
jgi:hypothetical protein